MPSLEGKTPGGGRNPAAQRLPRPAGAPAGACFWLTVGQSGAARQNRV